MSRKKVKKIYKTAYSAQEKLNALKSLKCNDIYFVAHRYHCTIQTIYRWKRLYDGTIESLEPKYCAPYTPHPNSHTEEEIKHIKDLIRRNPNIGLNELYGKLRLNYAYRRHPMGLYNFLRKHGWYDNVKKKSNYKPQPYATPLHIGEKWQLDVKYIPRNCYVGEFKDERKFYQYTVIDEATRERFIFPYQEQCGSSTIDFLKRAIDYFGYKPNIIQTDNGAEFTYTRQTRHDQEHLLDKFCRINKIEHKLIKPRTPRHNGLTTTIYIKVNNPEQHTLSANDFSIISDGKVVKASKINDKESYKVYEEDEIVEIQFYTTKADVPLTIFYKDKELNLKFKTFIFEI